MKNNSSNISVVLPIYNEEENIPELFERIFSILDDLGQPYEIIAVDDGSEDRSMDELRKIAKKHRRLQVLEFRVNRGQTTAIQAGLDYCNGDIVVLMDADLQNDPADIPRLLQKLDEGYDVVSGWRRNRQDSQIRRTFPSRVANSLISRVSGVRLRDYGCTLKAYRPGILSQSHRLYGEMHRFIPIYASWAGARIVEIEVTHNPRRHGKSSYGMERAIKVLLDLVVVMFMQRYFEKPIYVFGGFGILSVVIGATVFLYMIYIKVAHDISMINTPLPLVVSMFVLVGVTSMLLGLLAEIMVRIYYESQNRRTYSIRTYLNKPKDRTCAE